MHVEEGGGARPERLRDVDEGELLRRIFPFFPAGAGVLVPPGDDAAVVAAGSGSVIATTDSMVRGRDWRDDWSGAHDVGLKVVAQNVADVAAMGGVVTGLLVSLVADPQTPLEWVLDLARGIGEAAADAATSVVGGDLSSAPAGVVVVSVTALGDLQGRAPVLRSGARIGDVVAVAGSLGWSGGGLSLYAAGTPVPRLGRRSSSLEKARSILMWAHRTAARPPYESGPLAARAGAHALIDVSDGLVRDTARIAVASGVEIVLSGEALAGFCEGPLDEALGREEAMRQVLSGGEEHSLVGCFAPDGVPEDEAAPWRVVGTVVASGAAGPRVTVDGVVPAVSGWDHFHP